MKIIYKQRPWRPRSRKTYRSFDYHGSRWKNCVTACLELAGYRCEIPGCNMRYPRIHVNHKITPRMAPHLAYEPSNHQALCMRHHAIFHGHSVIPKHWMEPQITNPAQPKLFRELPDPWQLAADVHEVNMKKR